MDIEAAADVGVELGHHIAVARRNGSHPTDDLDRSLDRMAQAAGSTPLDAMAFAVFARTLLASALADMPPERDEAPSHPVTLVNVATYLVQRTVETLEQATGYGAETFTGELDAIN
jgi:hypothetical protein